MILQRLILRNFRNFEEMSIQFSSRVNVIFGANAQGKTNLIEAIHLISCGKSFRTVQLQDLIREGQNYFFIKAEFVRDGLAQSIEIYYDGSSKKLKINQTEYSQFSPLLGVLPSILLTPDDPALIDGPPKDRRNFLDAFLAQADPLYVHHFIRFHKAMKQRNHLLKQRSSHTIDIWEKQMAVSGAYLIEKRKALLETITPSLTSLVNQLSEGWDAMGTSYQSSHSQSAFTGPLEAQLLHSWNTMRAKEMVFGTTLTGPHRDDLHFLLKDRPARIFASEGQKKTLAISLRFVQWQTLKEMLGASPLLSLDDFGAHLDDHRHQILKKHLDSFGQVFITLPMLEAEHIAFPSSHHIHIENGHAINL